MPPTRERSAPWLIVGAGGQGASVAEVLCASGATIAGFVDDAKETPPIALDVPVLSEVPQGHIDRGWPIAVAIGDNFQREVVQRRLAERGATDACYPSVAHPSANVSRFAKLGAGSFFFQGANVGPGAQIGRFCVLATGATATHHAVMADFSFLAVHAVLGAASLGERSFVGLGAVVHQGCSIGADVVVGAQSYVRGDLPEGTVAHGVPAHVQRSRYKGEPYLSLRSTTVRW